MMNFRLEVQK